ncbi:hypothetical protein [Psychroflexus sediminis]|uniref:Uncharacterized protein n=1 Tax=Psychroflexus sediminis TaxID=470826 RepID=A0A1G7XEY3_9FLAO|nr:hypothetical protein [Psychroflexus sediminis]SDG82100.1 hypothetical protein SAMN04488027_10835 [Psychroflexus sediminis]
MKLTYKRLIDVTLDELKHELVKEIKKEFKADFTRELRALLKDLKYNEPTRWVSRANLNSSEKNGLHKKQLFRNIPKK